MRQRLVQLLQVMDAIQNYVWQPICGNCHILFGRRIHRLTCCEVEPVKHSAVQQIPILNGYCSMSA